MTGVFVSLNPTGRRGMAGWVEDGSGCHVWQGSTSTQGYGTAYDGNRTDYVHRIRYRREIGPIPAGMDLDHFRCDNRLCCNPAHVRPVTRRENSLRGNGPAAVHASRTQCPKGHPYAGHNLKLAADGSRLCRTCQNEAVRRIYARKAGAQ